MGRTGYETHKFILEEFENMSKTELTLKEMNKKIKTKNFPELDQKKFDKAFFRDINKLLNSYKIEITGYQIDEDKVLKQSFNPDQLLIKCSKKLTRPYIKEKLTKMNDDIESYQKIRRLFKKKLVDFDNFMDLKWNYLNSNVFSAFHKEIKKELSMFVGIENKIAEMSKNDREEMVRAFSSEYEYGKGYSRWDKLYLRFEIDNTPINTVRRFNAAALLILLSNYEDNKDAQIWFYPQTPTQFNDPLVLYPTENKSVGAIYSTPHPLGLQEIDKFLFSYIKIDEKGEWNKWLAIEKAGFKYDARMIKDSDHAFERVIDIISTYPTEERAILIEILAKALCDEPGSFQIFIEFYREIERINYRDRLSNVLGIFSKKPKRNDLESLTAAIEDLNRRENSKEYEKKLDRYINSFIG